MQREGGSAAAAGRHRSESSLPREINSELSDTKNNKYYNYLSTYISVSTYPYVRTYVLPYFFSYGK